MPSATPNSQVNAAAPLHIFKPGEHTAMSGARLAFTPAALRATVAAYNPALHEAPLVVGHPQHDLPAYGWVQSLRFSEGEGDGSDADLPAGLYALPAQVNPDFADMVAAGAFKKISASFYAPDSPGNPAPGAYYLRHVGFLGAQPPAVKGLRNPKFSEGEEGIVEFNEAFDLPAPSIESPPQEQDDMTKELQAQLDDATAQLARAQADTAAAKKAAEVAQAQAAQFAERAKADRKAQFVSFAETQLKTGQLLPKDKDLAVATLVALDSAEPVEFSEGDATRKVSLAQWLQDLIAGSAAKVQFGEFAGGREPTAGAGSAKGKTDAEIDKAAQAYAAKNKVSYAEAATAVTSFEA